MGLLKKLWSALRALPGLIFPFLVKAATFRGWSPWVRWLVHFLCLVLVLIGLAFLNYHFDLERILRTPWPILRKIWLPLLFFLIYLLGWLGVWLWRLLGPEETISPFPDIDAAWSEALRALDKAGIGLAEAPLFLVLGKPRGGEESLFSAAQLSLQVNHVPRRPGSPLHFYASRDGIFVTCAGASLLSRQAELFAEEDAGGSRGEAPGELAGALMTPLARNQPQKRSLTLQDLSAPAASTPPAPARRESSPGTIPQTLLTDAERGRQRQLLHNNDEAEMLTARLKYLCHLAAQARRPYCPLNGLMLLLPWAALDNDLEAQQTARLVQRDLEAVRQISQVECPIFALVCDLELEEGFRQLFQRLPENVRQQRLGRAFPLVPDVDSAALPEMFQGGMGWVCDTLFPSLVYRLFQVEPAGRHPADQAVAGNVQLYQLLEQMRQRRQRLGDLLKRALRDRDGAPPLFGGCYFAATGRDPVLEQAFVAGVFPRLVECQNFVSWTPAALAEEAAFQRGTLLGYGGLGLVGVLLLGATYFFWLGR
jgi:hypothetical protein